jgi:hypothetical protein
MAIQTSHDGARPASPRHTGPWLCGALLPMPARGHSMTCQRRRPIPCGSNYHRLLTQPPVPFHGGVSVHHELRLVLRHAVGAMNVQIEHYGRWPSWWSEPRTPGHYLFCTRAIVTRDFIPLFLPRGSEDRR